MGNLTLQRDKLAQAPVSDNRGGHGHAASSARIDALERERAALLAGKATAEEVRAKAPPRLWAPPALVKGPFSPDCDLCV